MARKDYKKKDRCPTCPGLKRVTARFCKNCSKAIRAKAKQQVAALVELDRYNKGQAYVDDLAESIVPPMARAE